MIGVLNSFPRQRKARSVVAASKRRKWATSMKIPRKSFKLFICKLCGIEKSSSIVRHYIHLRSHGLRTISRARYRCTSCLFYFTSPAWLRFHQSKEKRDLVKKRKLIWKLPYLEAPLRIHYSKLKGRQASWGRGVRGTKCEECEYDGPELEQHLESAHGLVSPFQCRYCDFSNRFYSQYKLHRKVAHKKGGRKKRKRTSPTKLKTTKCAECSEYDGPNLLEHLEQVHRLTRPFQCSSCPFSTGAYSLFKIHRSTHRQSGKRNMLKKCRECDDYDGPELLNHLAQAHGMTKPFQCSGCPRVFSAYSHFLIHRERAHRPKEAPQKLGMGVKYELKMGIKCEECEDYEGRQVYSHLKAVHGLPRPFQCPHCRYTTELYTNFKSHRASHFPPEDQGAKPSRRVTECGECDDYDGSELYPHLSEAHNLLKPFKCSKCRFKGSYYSQFKLHRDRCNPSAGGSNRNDGDIPMTKQPLDGRKQINQDMIRCNECNEHDGLNIYDHLQNTHKMSRPFKCSQCEYITDFYTNFKIHQGKHWPEKIQGNKGWNRLWKCRECDEYDGSELYAHLLDAHGMKKPLKCSLCDKVFSYYSLLLEHRKSHLRVATKCEDCDEYDGADLAVHLKDKHEMTPPYSCIHCKSEHTSYTSLVKHRKSHKKEMIKCEECQEYEGLDIYGHLATTHGMSPPFSCSICPEQFMTYTRLKRHHDVRWSKGGRCGECDAQVDTDLASHLESVHQLKSPFHCSMCEFTHKFYSIYKAHKQKRHGSTGNGMVKAQVGRKATKCRECTDYDGPNLTKHLEEDHGIKFPFKCPDCPFTCLYYIKFSEHRKSHVPSKFQGQHRCGICGARFQLLGHLTIHLNRQHRQPTALMEQPTNEALLGQPNAALLGQPNEMLLEQPNKASLEQRSKASMEPYTCPFCETNMIKVKLFKLHVLNHCQNEPQNPLKCHICGRFFPTTKTFLEHISEQHDPNAIKTIPEIIDVDMDPQMMNMNTLNGEGIHKETLRTFQEQDLSQGSYSPEVSFTENDSIYEPLNYDEFQVNPIEMDYNNLENGVQNFDVDEHDDEEEEEEEIIGCQDCGQFFYDEESYLIHTTKHRVPSVKLTRAFVCQDTPIYV